MYELSREGGVEVQVACIRKASLLLPDGSLASGLQICGWERAGEAYTTVASEDKRKFWLITKTVPLDGHLDSLARFQEIGRRNIKLLELIP